MEQARSQFLKVNICYGPSGGSKDICINNKKAGCPGFLKNIYAGYLDFLPLAAVPFHSQTYPLTLPEKSVVSAHFPFLPLRMRKLCPDAADG